MKKYFRHILVGLLMAALAIPPAYAAVSKLSQINSGGAIVVSTDTVVGVRNSNTDVLLTLAASAQTDTTNASNISAGTLAAARGGAGAVSGIMKANGSGAVSAASAGTDYQAPITLTTTGSSGAATFVANTLNVPQYSGGISRSISTVTTTTSAASAANTDYVYLCNGTFTITLPTAVGNTNRYTIINIGTGVVTVAFTGGQTANGSATVAQSVQYTGLDFLSNNANWNID